MKYELWFDGSCLPTNPGLKTVGGCIIKNEKGECVFKASVPRVHETPQSNNYAEYHGLYLGLEWLSAKGGSFESATIRGDSQMVIFQMLGKYRIKDGNMYTAMARKTAKFLSESGLRPKLEFHWIPREENWEADALTK
jgi:ribonuclease HI